MANKTIENLDTLDINNYNPDEDLLIVQKPNGATYHMSATNIMNPVAGGIVHLDEEVLIFQDSASKDVTFDLSNYAPSTASTAILSAMQPPDGVDYVVTPHFGLRWFNNSNFSGNGHYIRINASGPATWGGVQIMCPIINQKIYFRAEVSHTQASVVLNAYM